MPLLSSEKFWFKDATASGSNFGSLQDGGASPTRATLAATDWRLTAVAFPRYALIDYGATGVTVTSSSALPSANPDNSTGDGFRSESAITRCWVAGDWPFSIPVIRTSGVAGTADGLIRVRLWRSANADMSSPTEITSSAADSSAFTNIVGTEQILTGSIALGMVTLNAEYLLIQVAVQQDGVGSDFVSLRVGPDAWILPPDETTDPAKLPLSWWARRALPRVAPWAPTLLSPFQYVAPAAPVDQPLPLVLRAPIAPAAAPAPARPLFAVADWSVPDCSWSGPHPPSPPAGPVGPIIQFPEPPPGLPNWPIPDSSWQAKPLPPPPRFPPPFPLGKTPVFAIPEWSVPDSSWQHPPLPPPARHPPPSPLPRGPVFAVPEWSIPDLSWRGVHPMRLIPAQPPLPEPPPPSPPGVPDWPIPDLSWRGLHPMRLVPPRRMHEHATPPDPSGLPDWPVPDLSWSASIGRVARAAPVAVVSSAPMPQGVADPDVAWIRLPMLGRDVERRPLAPAPASPHVEEAAAFPDLSWQRTSSATLAPAAPHPALSPPVPAGLPDWPVPDLAWRGMHPPRPIPAQPPQPEPEPILPTGLPDWAVPDLSWELSDWRMPERVVERPPPRVRFVPAPDADPFPIVLLAGPARPATATPVRDATRALVVVEAPPDPSATELVMPRRALPAVAPWRYQATQRMTLRVRPRRRYGIDVVASSSAAGILVESVADSATVPVQTAGSAEIDTRTTSTGAAVAVVVPATQSIDTEQTDE